jgi:hypothetical protein
MIYERCGEYGVVHSKNNTRATGVHIPNVIFLTNIGSQYVHSRYKVQLAYRGPGK